ncbi:hypothetical protein ASG68_29500 [Rhizobium sp. Leaf453]|nr:hypothetical protein ASG50_29050 [Rhizobium sp. Leaf386]KQU00874.1 hypothetical protein ASG68_29500 [Rhizobium sp. Leaf453]
MISGIMHCTALLRSLVCEFHQYAYPAGLIISICRGAGRQFISVQGEYAASMLYQERVKALKRADNVLAILNQA